MENMRLDEFLEELGAAKATPGGGSAAALAGGLAGALAAMVSGLSIKKAEKDQAQEFEKIKEEARALSQDLLTLVEKDAQSFAAVMEAFGLPKETQEEKDKRRQAIQEAFKGAASVPLEVMEKCLSAMEMAQYGVEKGNPNCITDGAVGVLMGYAALEGAAMNVRINLGSIKDEQFVQEAQRRLENVRRKSKELKDAMEEILEAAI